MPPPLKIILSAVLASAATFVAMMIALGIAAAIGGSWPSSRLPVLFIGIAAADLALSIGGVLLFIGLTKSAAAERGLRLALGVVVTAVAMVSALFMGFITLVVFNR